MSASIPIRINRKRILQFLLPLLVWILLATIGGGLLNRFESRDLFLFTPEFLKDMLAVPGGFLAYIAAFLTQFLHYRWAGALLLVILYTIIVKTGKKAYNISDGHFATSLIPAALLLAALMHTGYMVFKLKYHSPAFTPALGALAVTLTVLVTSKSLKRGKEHIWITVWTLVSYPLFGFWGLIGSISSLISVIRQKKMSNVRTSFAVLAIIVAITLIPLVCHFVYGISRTASCWFAMFPIFPKGSGFTYILPYILLAVWYITAPLITIKCQKIAAAALAVSVALLWCKDSCLNAELEMAAAIENDDWERIVRIHRNTTRIIWNEPTRLMVMYKDLALFKLKREGDEAYTLRCGNREQRSAIKIPLTIQAGKQFYLHYGLPNFCYRWCIETYAETGWSYSNLKYAASSSLLAGNSSTAVKYCMILKKTLFYRKWADRQLQIALNPEMIYESEEYRSIIPMLCKEDWLDNDMSQLEEFLQGLFVDRIPENAQPDYWRAALFHAANGCDIDTFWNFYEKYIQSNRFDRLPAHYQEAVLLFAGISRGVNISKIPVDSSVRASYAAYCKFIEQHPDISQASDEFRLYFGRTYYYYWNTFANLNQ